MAASLYTNSQYTSAQFVESAGAILFHVSSRKICILYHHERQQWLLAKGRRNLGESRSTTAMRETEEETGFPCHLLPVTLRTRCPPAVEVDAYTPDEARMAKGVCEPFMVTHRVLPPPNGVKLIWWYVGEVKGDVTLGQGEKEFSALLMGFEEAVGALTFEDDREIVREAIRVFEETYGAQM